MKFEELSQVSSYVSERIEINNLSLENYISTENMISERRGVVEASKLPTGKTTIAFKKGDILISNIRPYFKKIWLADKSGGCSNDVLVIRANEKISNRFLYYVLSSNNFFAYAVGTSKGTKMPRGDKKAIMKYSVPLFSFEEQEKIANILSSYDKKIFLNKQINHHLEQMAQVLFEQVYYDGSSAQLGDALSTLESGSRPKGGAELDGIPSIGAENIERFGQYDYTKEKFISHEYFKRLNRGVVHSGDVLLYKDGAYTGKVSMALDGFPHAQCAVNEHIFILRPNELAPSSFFLYFLLLNSENKQALFSRASSKAAQPGLNQTEVKTLPILLPKIEKIVEFDNTIAPFMHQIAKNANENRKLSTLRDTLLPKLLSGEISVN
ncbi:restriction endonuclease subunit S [Streptococcus mutans]|uniref:restriction endonuclease subunit S n=3 Tax=Streptococcus mutans TaxID=1309 RepID=UPI00046534D9|nr:restriction endonuclease subunit S [Streptococcus mutans]